MTSHGIPFPVRYVHEHCSGCGSGNKGMHYDNDDDDEYTACDGRGMNDPLPLQEFLCSSREFDALISRDDSSKEGPLVSILSS